MRWNLLRLNHALGAGLIAGPVNQQPSALPLCYGWSSLYLSTIITVLYIVSAIHNKTINLNLSWLCAYCKRLLCDYWRLSDETLEEDVSHVQIVPLIAAGDWGIRRTVSMTNSTFSWNASTMKGKTRMDDITRRKKVYHEYVRFIEGLAGTHCGYVILVKLPKTKKTNIISTAIIMQRKCPYRYSHMI